MLRVGLTGELGSGKSTVAQMLTRRGAVVFSSDEIGRALMQPGEQVYGEIVAAFGSGIVAADGAIDRRKLARLAFDKERPRVDELNAIVHPAVIECERRQMEELASRCPDAIAVVESALIFSTVYAPGGDWHARFDRILVVDAPEEQKIARFVGRAAATGAISAEERSEAEADARRRLAVQHETPYPDNCIVLRNDTGMEQLEQQVSIVWEHLKQLEVIHRAS